MSYHPDPGGSPGDRGVEQLPGQQRRRQRRQYDRHLLELAALRLVDRDRMHGLDIDQLRRRQQQRFQTPLEGGPGPGRGGHDDPGVTVSDPQVDIILGHQQRPPHIPFATVLLTEHLLHPLLDQPGPGAGSVRAVPVSAEDPVPPQRLQRLIHLPRPGGGVGLRPGLLGDLDHVGQVSDQPVVVQRDQSHLFSAAQQVKRRFWFAGSD